MASRYSMMAPDSQRVSEVFGSVIAGTRPFGLRDSKGSVWIVFVREEMVLVGRAGRRTFFEITKVLEFGLVGNVELVEDDGYFPWVGALCLRLDERSVVVRRVMIVTHASVAV